MLFPTVISKQDQVIHIVKDQKETECAFIYHHFATVNRSDLRRIKFIHLDSITCDICLQNYLKQNKKSSHL